MFERRDNAMKNKINRLRNYVMIERVDKLFDLYERGKKRFVYGRAGFI